MLAPLPLNGQSPAEALAGERIPGEAHLRPREGDRVSVNGAQRFWKKQHAPEFFLDFNRAVGRLTEHSLGYAVCYLVADRPRKGMVLKIGSDDEVGAWLNGRPILRVDRPRGLTLDDDVIAGVDLERGTNVLLLKVINETLDWCACARLTEANGQPVAGVRVMPAPP